MEEMKPPMARARRSSLFEVSRRSMPVASSITFHACEPHAEEEPVIRQPKIQFENTYRMEPEGKFPSGKAEAIMRKVLEENLSDKTYNPIGCSVLSKLMVQDIKNQVMEFRPDRYKVVCLVNIGEKKEQGVRIGSRCVWDTQRDNYAAVEYETPELFATAMTYALYYE